MASKEDKNYRGEAALIPIKGELIELLAKGENVKTDLGAFSLLAAGGLE